MLKKEVLRNQKNFNDVYKKGSSKGSRYMVVLYRKNGLEYTRIAFLASKKVGNSVERNRARRLMKESCRSVSKEIEEGFDIIFVARNTIKKCKKKDVEKSMYGTLKATGIMKKGLKK